MKKFSLYIYTLVHNKLFLYMHWNSFSLRHTVYIQTLFTFKDFFRFSQHTPLVHTKVSLYTLVAHTHRDFFSHITYTRKNPSIRIFFLHTYMRNIFLFLYIRRHLFTTLLSFYHDFGSFF